VKLQRLLTVGLLLAFVFSAVSALPASVVAEVYDDGSLVLEGVRYTDPAPLKEALKRLEQRHASIDIHVRAKPTVKFEAIGKAIILLQKAGCADKCMKVGFITGPASSH